MRMNRNVAIAAVLAVGTLGALAGSGAAQDAGIARAGVHPDYTLEEAYDLELGVTVSGRPGLPARFREVRSAVAVPAHYGDLFQITQDGHDSVLWYRAQDGALRNVVLAGTTTTSYQVGRVEPLRYESKIR